MDMDMDRDTVGGRDRDSVFMSDRPVRRRVKHRRLPVARRVFYASSSRESEMLCVTTPGGTMKTSDSRRVLRR
jgi:hypothetical protein